MDGQLNTNETVVFLLFVTASFFLILIDRKKMPYALLLLVNAFFVPCFSFGPLFLKYIVVFCCGVEFGLACFFLIKSENVKSPPEELKSNWQNMKCEVFDSGPSKRAIEAAKKMDESMSKSKEDNRLAKIAFLKMQIESAEGPEAVDYILDEIHKLKNSKKDV